MGELDIDLESGVIGKYRILKKLGEGAMGSVHLVRDGHLERNVAYKQLLAQWRESTAGAPRSRAA